MGQCPTRWNESHLRRYPRESGGPPVDSRLRGNDVTLERVPRTRNQTLYCPHPCLGFCFELFSLTSDH